MRRLIIALLACLVCHAWQDASAASLHQQICRKMGVGFSSGYHAETCCTGCAPYSNGVRRPCYTPVYVGCGPQGCGATPIHGEGEYVPAPEPARAAQIYHTPVGWGRSLEVIAP
ncbi:MAG: hypothetical protein KF708_17425 [Pirellulales bacterium]|nr:hypothetical protein [Pirellulales bacterium]